MKPQPNPPVLVIGVGNDYRGDDGVGLVLARRLEARLQEGARVLEQSRDGVALMEMWRGARAVVLLDAVQSGFEPGMIHRLDARTQPVGSWFFYDSTHAFGVVEAIELARALGELPLRFIVYAIEGANFTTGTMLSPEIENVLTEAERRVREEIKELAFEIPPS